MVAARVSAHAVDLAGSPPHLSTGEYTILDRMVRRNILL